MSLQLNAASRAATGVFALLGALALAGCSDVFGESPPHAAPANPVAEGADGRVELSWNAVTGARNYVIVWSDAATGELTNVIGDLTGTSFSHTGLTNFVTYRYRIAAETGGGRGPQSILVSAEPGPVPGPVEWTVVTAQDPGHTIHFAPAAQATGYRVYLSLAREQLAGRRPNAPFEEATASPHLRPTIPLSSAIYYRVIAMNGSRIGTDGPVSVSPARTVSNLDHPRAGAAFGDPNDDDCSDTVTALGNKSGTACLNTFTARVLADVGLGDLTAAGRTAGDSRYADFSGDLRDDLFSTTLSPAGTAASIALMHVNQGTGSFQTSAGVSALAIGGFGGTTLAADFDNDGDIDLFAPNDHTQGDGARNWLLQNAGGVFTDIATAAGVDDNPAGADYVPRGGQAVDFDEDGFVDLLFGSRLLLNNGDGTFSDGSAAAGIPVRADHGLKLIDVDLDGDLDLLHHDGVAVRLHLNDGGVFGAGTVVAEDTTQATFGEGLNVCDVNSDGFEDVVFARNATATGTGTPRMLVNVAGTLMPSAVQSGSAAAGDLVAANDLLACADFDANGVTDILARWGTAYRSLVAPQPLATVIRIRVLGAGGERNQQGRVVRIVPQGQPDRIMTRVVESGSGLRAQNQYDLLVGAPWLGEYDISVRFAGGVVNATAEPGDSLTIHADGRVVDGLQ
ncbi:MAG TPA: FG-GAP-like repeat-containing protein [Steroidobacteraceae bacterium]|nr:FG-GAP-like repeat-containing protein [Steroidobacteraceae bacterium]